MPPNGSRPLTAVLGLVAMAAGSLLAPLAPAVWAVLDGPLSPFRNVHKFDPLLRLPLALGVAAAVLALATWVTRALAGRTWSSPHAARWGAALPAGAAALLVVATAAPLVSPGWLRGGALDGATERATFAKALEGHTRGTWKKPKTRSVFKYSLALLTDPSDPLPPSDQQSLRYLPESPRRCRSRSSPSTRTTWNRLAEFDALFIRVTTAIDNYTYRFARRAQQEGMVVIDNPADDDPLHQQGVCRRAPDGRGRAHARHAHRAEQAGGRDRRAPRWPVVIKSPDGSFSRGVFKCNDAAALKSKLKELLASSDLVIAQQFVPTAFDWRIGVLDGKAFFAAQYLMAKPLAGHETQRPRAPTAASRPSSSATCRSASSRPP